MTIDIRYVKTHLNKVANNGDSLSRQHFQYSLRYTVGTTGYITMELCDLVRYLARHWLYTVLK